MFSNCYIDIHWKFNNENDSFTGDFSHHLLHTVASWSHEPRRQKTGLRGFRPGPTQTGLYSHRRWLEAWNFGFRKQRDCTIRVAKTKALISFAVTAKLICVFVFAYAQIRFSHVAAHIILLTNIMFVAILSEIIDRWHLNICIL